MSEHTAYTLLESYLLFKSLLVQGVHTDTFSRISTELLDNGLIKADETYSSARLRPEALQVQFFRLFGEALRGDGDTTTASDATTPIVMTSNATTPAPTSPNSKKRKLGGPPVYTWKDVAENIQKLPFIQERLYKRYEADIIKKIRDDENNHDGLQKALQVIEKSETLRLAARNNAQNASSAAMPVAPPTLAPRETKSVARPSASMAASMSSPAPPTSAGKWPPATTPVVPPKLPSPNIAPPTHPPRGTPPPSRPASTAVPTAGATPVLQAPTAATQQTPPSGVLQAPVQPPKVLISPRHEVIGQAKPAPSTPQPTTGSGPLQLKWEPYVPSQQQTPSRQYQQQAPPKTLLPQQPRPQQGQQQLQNLPPQNLQGVQPPAVPTPSINAQAMGNPLLVPPQSPAQPLAGMMVPQSPSHIAPPQNTGSVGPQQPPMQSAQAARLAAGASPSPAPRPPSKSPAPATSHRPIQPQQGPPSQQQPRPIAAAASLTPQPGASGVTAPPQKWATPPIRGPQQSAQQPGTPTPAPSQKNAASGNKQPQPPIPEHIIRHVAAGTPLGPRRTSSVPTVPQTPVQSTPQTLIRGLMTNWGHQPTLSTPGGTLMGDQPSPAYDPLSPPQKPAPLPQSTPLVPKKLATKATPVAEARPSSGRGSSRGRPRGSGFRGRRLSATPSAGPSAARRSQSIISQTDELSMDHVQKTTEVKNEEATPRPHEETGDTTADESVSGRGNITTPGSMRILKRKRPETPAESPGPPTYVLWTRGFTKVSSSALDQISSHRDANMFATGVRERDAPNYRQIVLQPQDITSIRSAIKQGNKAALAAAANLPGGDPATASVALPISEDLVPPKGIVNSAQLERELVHMFCNAIMYNPDPYRGPGQSFMKRSPEEEEEAFGYQFDENGVVRNTQAMFLEVEKLLGDLRSAEKDRTARPLSTPRLTSTAATPADDTADDEDELAGDGGEGSGPFKRRRVRG